MVGSQTEPPCFSGVGPLRFFVEIPANGSIQQGIAGWWLSHPSEKYESQLR